MLSNNEDKLALTNIWLGNLIDKPVIFKFTPNEYSINFILRKWMTGGNAVVIY